MSTEQVRHPTFAKLYARFAPQMDKVGGAEHREELLAGLSGRVIEVGAGTGLNFKRYPVTVTEVVAVEPEESLRALAASAAADAPVPVTVIDGVASALPVDDASFDAAVASLMLCSVRDLPKALAEMHRAVRPGGELRFYEHVRSGSRVLGVMQRGLDVVWPHLFGGCHTSRDTATAIRAAGFEVERIRNFSFRPSPIAAPVAPHIIGSARRP
jgi:ubiquinone/menaquinone biosynthesis C-methylase UbiE